MSVGHNPIHADDAGHTVAQGRSAPGASLFSGDDPFVRFLLDNSRRVFYMKPYNGNSGDALIWLGTKHLLADLRIPRTMDPKAADIILMPGGNQTMWQLNIDIWKEVWSKYPDKDFAAGPTTVQLGVTSWLDDVRQSKAHIAAIFARDPQSYANLQTCGLDADIKVGLSHDPAIYLNGSQWVRDHREAATEDFILAAFRDDHEGTGGAAGLRGTWAERLFPRLCARIDRRWRDRGRRQKLAQVARHKRSARPLKMCDVSRYSFEYFVEIVRSAAEVHTDRLHCMLLAVMLGKATFAYPTTYGKLEAVYAHSLKSWAQVEFVPGTQVSWGRELPAGPA